MVERVFIRSPIVRVIAFLLLGSLFVLSLFGLYRAETTPAEREVSTPVVQYRHQGTFDYRVKLRPNSLFETTELEPGQTYFARLVEHVRMTYSYELRVDEAEEKQFTYQVTALLGTPGLWERRFALVPPTTTNDDFTTSFVVPIPQFLELIDAIRQETRTAAGLPELTIKVLVRPQVQTGHGVISDPFEQTLLFRFDDERITAEDTLEQTRTGTINEVESVPTAGLNRLRFLSIAGLLLSLGLITILSVAVVQHRRQIPDAERELRQAEKQLKGLLLRADTLPSGRDGQIVIQLSELADLLDMAEETYQPVVYARDEREVRYCVIAGSGSVRYEYTSQADRRTPLRQAPPNGDTPAERTEVTHE